jgi:peptidoglycan hydrolase CwlO-like protein
LDESPFFSLTPDEMAVFGALLGFALTKPLTIDEQNVLGNVLIEAGEILLVVAAQRTLLESIKKEQENKEQQNQKPSEDVQSQIEQLQKQIQQLQNQIDQLKQPARQ